MEPTNTPTMADLEAIQKKLVQNIKEAQKLFGDRHELLTSKAALKSIKEMMNSARRRVA